MIFSQLSPPVFSYWMQQNTCAVSSSHPSSFTTSLLSFVDIMQFLKTSLVRGCGWCYNKYLFKLLTKKVNGTVGEERKRKWGIFLKNMKTWNVKHESFQWKGFNWKTTLLESPAPPSPQHSQFDLSPDVLEVEKNILPFGNRWTHLDCVRGSWLC